MRNRALGYLSERNYDNFFDQTTGLAVIFLTVISRTVPIGEPLYFSLRFTDKRACVGKHKKSCSCVHNHDFQCLNLHILGKCSKLQFVYEQ